MPRVGVLAHLELLLVGVVARVDADLLHVLGGSQRCVRGEVDVGHQRRAHAAALELGADRAQVLGLFQGGRRDAHDLAARSDQALHLVCRARGV
jgi:hypothetical protein